MPTTTTTRSQLSYLADQMNKLKQKGTHFKLRVLEEPQAPECVFDGKRVINLGGIHGPETADVQVDTLGLTKESEYPLDFFYAERHTGGSNMLLTTSLGLVPAMIN